MIKMGRNEIKNNMALTGNARKILRPVMLIPIPVWVMIPDPIVKPAARLIVSISESFPFLSFNYLPPHTASDQMHQYMPYFLTASLQASKQA